MIEIKKPTLERAEIRLKLKKSGRRTAWTVDCNRCGNVALVSTKVAASRLAVEHAEKVHDRRVRIHVPA